MMDELATAVWTYRNIECRLYECDDICSIGYVKIGDEWLRVFDDQRIAAGDIRDLIEDEVDDIIDDVASDDDTLQYEPHDYPAPYTDQFDIDDGPDIAPHDDPTWETETTDFEYDQKM